MTRITTPPKNMNRLLPTVNALTPLTISQRPKSTRMIHKRKAIGLEFKSPMWWLFLFFVSCELRRATSWDEKYFPCVRLQEVLKVNIGALRILSASGHRPTYVCETDLGS